MSPSNISRILSIGVLTNVCLISICLTVFPDTAHAQNLIRNSGFEDTGSWTETGNVALGPYIDYAGLTPDPYNGSSAQLLYGDHGALFNVSDRDPDGVLLQTIATVPGGRYSVRFVYGNYNGSVGQRDQGITAQARDSLSGLVLSSMSVDDRTGPQTDLPTIFRTGYSFDFIASGTKTDIAFIDSGLSQTLSSDGLLDNVSVSAVATEPVTIHFVVMGLLGMVTLFRRSDLDQRRRGVSVADPSPLRTVM